VFIKGAMPVSYLSDFTGNCHSRSRSIDIITEKRAVYYIWTYVYK